MPVVKICYKLRLTVPNQHHKDIDDVIYKPRVANKKSSDSFQSLGASSYCVSELNPPDAALFRPGFFTV